MSDNRLDLAVAVSADEAVVGSGKASTAIKGISVSATEAAARTEALDKKQKQLAEQGLSMTTRELNRVIGQINRMRDAMSKSGTERFIGQLQRSGLGGAFAGEIAELQKLDKAAHEAHGGLAGISRELMVMGHETLMGNFSRLGGSAMVLGERLNVLKYLLSPMGGILVALAGALFAVGHAAYKASEQFDAFNSALTMTGNYAGLTEDRFNTLASTIAGSTGSSLSTARQALVDVAKTGMYTGEQVSAMGELIVAASRASGQSLEEVEKIYDGLAKDPSKWAVEHNASMHLMSVSTFQYIEALQKAGDTHAAVQAAMDAALAQVETSSQKHLSVAAEAWNGLKNAIEGTIAALGRKISGSETIDDQITALQAKKSLYGEAPTPEIDNQIASLERLRRQQQQNADQIAAYQQKQDAAIKAEAEADKMRNEFATNAQKRAKALKELAQQKADIEAGGGTMPDYASLVAGINEKYKDKKPREGGINAGITTLRGDNQRSEAELKRHLDMLKSMYDDGEMVQAAYLQRVHDAQVAALKQQIAVDQQIADAAKKKRNPDALAAALNTLEAAQAKLDALQADPTGSGSAGNKDMYASLVQQDKLRAALSQQRRSYGAQNDEQFMPAQQQAQYRQMLQLREQYLQQVEALNEKYDATPTLKEQDRQTDLHQLADEYDQRLQMLAQQQAQEQQVRDSYSAQMRIAMTQLSGSGETAAQSTAQAFTSAWQSSANALTEFLTTGKGNFDQFVSGVLADMAKIALQWAEMQAMQGIGNMFSGLNFGGGAAAMSGAFGSTPATVSGAASWGLGSVAVATGGHISGPGTGTSDSIPAMLSNGEYVINAASTQRYRGLLDSINAGKLSKFATGGPVGSVSSASSSSSANPVSVTVHNSGGAGSLSEKDAKDLHAVVQGFVDKRMAQNMRGQGGYAYQMRYQQI